jgi:RecA-family ATPase
LTTPSHEDVTALRSQLYSNGYRPVAVYTQGKRPFGNAWQDRARQNPPGAIIEPVNDAALSTGILCDGLRAIDIDIDDSAIASEVERIAYGILGTAPARRRADSARALLLYRAASGEPCKRTIEGTMGSVEALGKGQQFVGFGVHEQGHTYTWAVSPAPYSVNALTAITEETLTAFLGAVASLIGALAVQPAPVAQTGNVAAFVDPALVTDADRTIALAALHGEYAKVCAVTSSRNNALNIAAHSLGTLVGNYSLDEAEVVSTLLEAATMNGYTQKPDGINRATKTIYSGLTSGKAKPRLLKSQEANAAHIAELRANLEAQRRNTTAPQPSPAKRSVELVRMAEVVEKPITWLWDGFLPLGKLTLLAGAGGTGKSTLAFSMASIVTTAGYWPNGTRCNVAGNVLIWSSEDDPADVIKPRLLAMNADVNRVGTIRAVKTLADGEVPFDPARDMDALRDAAKAIGGVTLLIIDPIVSAVSGDMHKANDVRRSLQAIVDFAAEMNCSVIGITHFAKNTTGRNPSERVIGSQAFAAFARMVLVAAKDEDTDNRVFTRAKSNISLDDGGFNYAIQEFILPGGIVTTRILWGAAIQGSSRDILATVEKSDNPNDSQPQRKEAKAFLHEELKRGPRPARELIELAKNQLGISEKTLRTAQHELGIVASKAGFSAGWLWSFPFTLAQPENVTAR